MKNFQKLYINNFIFNFVGFITIYWSFELFKISKSLLIELPIKSALFALLMTWITLRRYKKDLKKRGLIIIDENFQLVYQKEIKTEVNRDEIINQIKQSSEFKKRRITKTESGIKINTNYSWRSFGEVIEILFNYKNGTNHDILISSRPIFPLTINDIKSNKMNIEKIEALIKNVA